MYDPHLLSTYPNKKLLACLDNDNEKELLQHFSIDQTKINKQSKVGNTLLMKASKLGRKKICKLLIYFQANLDIQNNRGETALMRAVANGHASIATLLINAGATLDLQNNDGETALILACKLNQFKVASLLIASNADIRIMSNLKVFTVAKLSSYCHPCFGSALLYAGLHQNEVVFNEILEKAEWKKITLKSHKHPADKKVDKLHHIKTYASVKCYGVPYLSVLLEGALRSSSYLLFDYLIESKKEYLSEDGFCYAVEHCQLSYQMIEHVITVMEYDSGILTRALKRFTRKIKDEYYLIDVAQILTSFGANPSFKGKDNSAIMNAKKRRLYKLEEFLLDQINNPIPIAFPITVNTIEASAPFELELEESENPSSRFNMYEMKTGA